MPNIIHIILKINIILYCCLKLSAKGWSHTPYVLCQRVLVMILVVC